MKMKSSHRRSRVQFSVLVLAALGAACSGGGGDGEAVALEYSPSASGYPVGFPLELEPKSGSSATAYMVVSGDVPPGVDFDTGTGTFSGRPLVAQSSDLVVRASNGGATNDVELTLHVVPPPATRFLYVAETEKDLVSAFLVDSQSGAARPIGVAATGDEPRVLAVAPGSTHLAVGTKHNGVSLYAIDPVHGRLTELAGSPLALGSEVRDLVFHPDATHLYVLASSGPTEDLLFQLAFDAQTDTITPLAPPALSVAEGSIALAVDPLGRGLYATHGDSVRSFTIQPDGSLIEAGDRTGGIIPVDVAAAPDGESVYTLNFTTKDVWRYPVGSDGALLEGAHAQDVNASQPATIAITGDGEQVYVGNAAGSLETFQREPDGSLVAVPGLEPSFQSDLRGLAADPSGPGAWVTLGTANELVALTAGEDGTLVADLDTPVRTHGMPLGIAAAPGATPAVVRTTSLYAVNWEDDDFNQFAVAPDGELNALTPATVPTGNTPENVVAHPFLDCLHVSNSNDTLQAVQTFELADTGVATPLQPFGALKGSLSMLMGINGDLAFVILPDEIMTVSVSEDGSLTSIGTPPAVNSTGRAVRHPGGTWLYVPNGAIGGVLSFVIGLDGAVSNTGGVQADMDTNALAVDPTGRFLYAVNDTDGVDRVRGWAVDSSSGKLAELASSPFALPDQAVDSIAVAAHPSGRVLYVATRDNAGVSGQGAIHAFAIETDPDSGEGLGGLTPLGPSTLLSGEQPYDLAVTPDGGTLYVSIEAVAGSVLVYAIDPTGALSVNPVDSEPTGGRTRGLGLRTLVE
jgi:6-phosphogluconolactonase (cycloisomerase 2 family)